MLGLVTLAHQSDCTDKQKSEMFDLILVTALKLTAVWHHMDRYIKLEDDLIAEAYKNPINEKENKPVRISTSQTLYLELDGLLVQFKSTLDHMVHLLHFTYGFPFEGLTTFGDNGNKIRTQLTRNTGKATKDAGRSLSKFIEENQHWLIQVIELRDRMNHYKSGGIRPDNFTVFVRKIDGKDVLYVPRLAETQTVRELMEFLFHQLLDFVEFFMGQAMLPKLSRWGIHYKIKDDKKATRWELVPIDILRKYENDPRTRPMGE